jgi:hypothetical protein
MSTPSDEPSPSSSPDHSDRTPAVHHTSHLRLLLIFAASLALVIGAFFAVREWVFNPVHQPVCPQDCHGPPKGPPHVVQPTGQPGPPLPSGVLNPPASGQNSSSSSHATPQVDREAPRAAATAGQPLTQAVTPVQIFGQFQASDADGGFSFEYPAYAHKDQKGVSWRDAGNDVILLGGRTESTPKEIAQRIVRLLSPNATLSYEVPNARLGYESGYGEIDDFVPQSSGGSYVPQRVIVMVAVKNGVALVASAAGPVYNHRGGHPTGAKLFEVDRTPFYYWVNSFRWKGDPPR